MNAKPDPIPEKDKRRPLRSQLKRLKAAVGAKAPAPAPPAEKLPPRSAEQRDRVVARRGHLPTGTTISYLSIDGRGTYEGIMTVLGPDGQPVTFRHQAHGQFRCAQALDDLYRAWLAARAEKAT